MKKIAVIANGKHKKAFKLKEQLASFLPGNYSIIEKRTQKKGHATELTLEAINENAAIVIAAGGDGTMNEVINGIMQASEDVRKKVMAGLFPLGTGNDFARTAKLTKNVEELAGLIENESFTSIDIGLLEFTDEDGKNKTRYFNNIAEIGVGAKAVEIVNKSKKALGSTLTFFLGVLRAFMGYKQQRVTIRSGDFEWEGKVVAVCMANGRYFGSGLGIAPGALLDDGKLSLVVVGNIKMVHFLRYLPSLRKLKKIDHPQVHYLKTDHCSITGIQHHPVEMDGENVGCLPLSAKIIPRAVNLLARLPE